MIKLITKFIYWKKYFYKMRGFIGKGESLLTSFKKFLIFYFKTLKSVILRNKKYSEEQS